MATKSTLRADAPEFRMMMCGKHVRSLNITETPGQAFEPEEFYMRRLARGEKRGSCICDYYDYPKLLQERTHVDPDVETPTKPFPLFKLPAELRIKIYEYAVTSDEPIEFCPEPYFYNGLQDRRRLKGDWRGEYDRVKAHHRQMMKRAAVSAALLRVNKQLYSEVLPVFYGENEFRFSNFTGYIALDFFLHKIGLEKSSMLRKVTVCHPDCLRLPTSLTQGRDFRDGSPFLPIYVKKEPGFTYDVRWFDKEITTDPLLVLQKAGKLKQLRLVSPASTHFTFKHNPFDVSCFDDLEVTAVSLRSETLMPSIGQVIGVPWFHKDPEAAKHMADQHFEEPGEKWEFEDKIIDEFGRY